MAPKSAADVVEGAGVGSEVDLRNEKEEGMEKILKKFGDFFENSGKETDKNGNILFCTANIKGGK